MSQRPIATELRVMREYWDLLRDPVLRGRDVARGDGRLVLVLPGLFGSDVYLATLRNWLRRIGYRPAVSRIGVNAGCSDRLSQRVERAFGERLKRHDGEVAIIGHSRGGMLGKCLASRLGSRCTRFVALGSPVGAVLRSGPSGFAAMASSPEANAPDVAASGVVDAARASMRWLDPDCNAPLCGCAYMTDLFAPLAPATRVFSIYTTEDPIVAPDACPIDGATNIAVRGSHSGLVVNRAVYPHIAAALA